MVALGARVRTGLFAYRLTVDRHGPALAMNIFFFVDGGANLLT